MLSVIGRIGPYVRRRLDGSLQGRGMVHASGLLLRKQWTAIEIPFVRFGRAVRRTVLYMRRVA